MELNKTVVMEQNVNENSLISLLLKFEDLNQRVISEYDDMDNKMSLDHRIMRLKERLTSLISDINHAQKRLDLDENKDSLDYIKTLSEVK